MADKKIFNEETKSRLVDLYSNDFEKIVKQNASINLYNNDVTYLKIQRSMAHQPDVEICNKSCLLDLDNFDFNAMNRAAACLNLVPKSNETVVIEMCLVEKKPNVRFLHSNPSDVGRYALLLYPWHEIDLKRSLPSSSSRGESLFKFSIVFFVLMSICRFFSSLYYNMRFFIKYTTDGWVFFS